MQAYVERLQDYLLRKQKEAKMVLLDEQMTEPQIIEQIIRGIKETDPVKHKLLAKFGKGKIRLLSQLETQSAKALREQQGGGYAQLAASVQESENSDEVNWSASDGDQQCRYTQRGYTQPTKTDTKKQMEKRRRLLNAIYTPQQAVYLYI